MTNTPTPSQGDGELIARLRAYRGGDCDWRALMDEAAEALSRLSTSPIAEQTEARRHIEEAKRLLTKTATSRIGSDDWIIPEYGFRGALRALDAALAAMPSADVVARLSPWLAHKMHCSAQRDLHNDTECRCGLDAAMVSAVSLGDLPDE